MDGPLVAAVCVGLALALGNGLRDPANAIAGIVAARAATPGRAIVMAAALNVIGPLLVGSAVADAVAGIVTVSPDRGWSPWRAPTSP